MYMEFTGKGKDFKISYDYNTQEISYEIIQTRKNKMNIEEFCKHLILTGNGDIAKEIKKEII